MTPLIALIIMDGFGVSSDKIGNAILAADTPNLDEIMAKYPSTLLEASGARVGLPDNQMGNSEVGHANIGAGRIMHQELTRIGDEIESGRFFQNEALVQAMDNCLARGTVLHIMGLLSDGGVHSHTEHLKAVIQLAKKKGLTRVYIHAFLDGRDCAPNSGYGFVEELQNELKNIGVGKLATVCGRYYSMDRDNRFCRVEVAYNAIVNGEGMATNDVLSTISDNYRQDITDEFIQPVIVTPHKVETGDSIIFINFRPDRARELSHAICDVNFDCFVRKRGYIDTYYVCMTQYDELLKNVHIAYPPQKLTKTLGEVVADAGIKQLRIAETEKYAHVTFFFSGAEEPFVGEDRVLVPSPQVATYDLTPEMSEREITARAVQAVESGKYGLIVLNYANCDMVGHTGVFDAAVRAVRAVDEGVGQLVRAIEKAGGVAVITADHGNADCMCFGDGSTMTAHSLSPVPFVVTKSGIRLADGGALCDIAPTILELSGLSQPVEMTGKSLIVK